MQFLLTGFACLVYALSSVSSEALSERFPVCISLLCDGLTLAGRSQTATVPVPSVVNCCLFQSQLPAFYPSAVRANCFPRSLSILLSTRLY